MTEQITDSDSPACYQFDGKGGAAAVSLDEWKSSEETAWVPLDYSRPSHRDWLRQFSALDHLVVEALLAEDSRPRTTLIGNGLLIALRGVNLNPGADPEDMVAVRLWIDENRVISMRARTVMAVGDVNDDGYDDLVVAAHQFFLLFRLSWIGRKTIRVRHRSSGSRPQRFLANALFGLRGAPRLDPAAPCPGVTARNVTAGNVSGRVVNTVRSPKSISRPCDLPIQRRCIRLARSGQSRCSNPSSRRSAAAVDSSPRRASAARSSPASASSAA
mgnify:CR=1 FL=1